MRRLTSLALLVTVLTASGVALAAPFRLYPGAKTDAWCARYAREAEKAVKARAGANIEVGCYLTADPFEKVYAFYKTFAREDMGMRSVPRPTVKGQPIKWAFFVLDGAKTFATSKHWMKIQRPAIGDEEFKDVRDLTLIQVMRTR